MNHVKSKYIKLQLKSGKRGGDHFVKGYVDRFCVGTTFSRELAGKTTKRGRQVRSSLFGLLPSQITATETQVFRQLLAGDFKHIGLHLL